MQSRAHEVKVELTGEITKMIALTPGAESARKQPYRNSVKMVAGARYQRYYPLFVARVPRTKP